MHLRTGVNERNLGTYVLDNLLAGRTESLMLAASEELQLNRCYAEQVEDTLGIRETNSELYGVSGL